MNRAKAAILASVVTVTAIIAVLIVYYVTTGRGERAEIHLPGSMDSATPTVSDQPIFRDLNAQLVELTTENVQTIVAELERPQEYTAEISVSLKWQGGSSELRRDIHVRDGCTRIVAYDRDGAVVENTIVLGENTYVWNEGSSAFYTGSTGSMTADDAGQYPTYEDLLELEQSRIISASYLVRDGESCISVAANELQPDQTRTYLISLDSGLLISSEAIQEGRIVYSFEMEQLELTSPGLGLFTLPNGFNVILNTQIGD